DGIRDFHVTGVQTCALPICMHDEHARRVLAETVVFLGDVQSQHTHLGQHLPVVVAEALALARDLATFLEAPAVGRESAQAVCERSEERRVGKECRARWWTNQ